jgi:phage gpG-like protein
MPTVVATITYNRFPELARRLPQATQAVCLKTAMDAEDFVKAGMAEGKSGHWYGEHQASAPGEMPAIDQDALSSSITTEADGNGAVVYSDQEHAVHMEYGAPAANIEPRPFFGPAADHVRPAFIQAMRGLERQL